MRTTTFEACVIPFALVMGLCAMGCDPEVTPSPEETPDEALTVVSTSPADAAVNVPLDAALTITFSAPVQLTSAAELRVNPPVPGTLTLDEDDRTLRFVFSPSQGLSKATTYRATLSSGSVIGATTSMKPLTRDISWSFSTSITPPATQRGVYRQQESGEQMTVEVTRTSDTARTYEMTTTAALRDNDPADSRVVVTELATQPMTRTGSVVFDALFALSIQEARENSVSSISDGAFNNGQGVPCECFETGAKWNYVWTRDTAYAVDLGLAMLDPERARASLEFKLSSQKGEGEQTSQIVQDTGSGGSWPVSSDRVVWAIGAEALLHQLGGASREAFVSRTLIAMKNTAEQDRLAIFDARDGLYRGEQSFLDWREQSYPTWTAQDTVHLAMSKTLSTNVGHLRLLELLAALSRERGASQDAARYGAWAEALALAINQELWLDDVGLYSSMKLNDLAPQALYKYDLLGESLAVLSDVPGSAERASTVVSSYPHVPYGPAVLWPQQPLIKIYHNRGIWPFVTAYGLFAAKSVGNSEVFDLDLESLIRGAALNMSNMENFEFTTQKPSYDDGAYSGPAVNSRRQLWSVAGYFGAISRGVFGVEMGWDGVSIKPFITPRMHERYFAGQEKISLLGVSWRGHLIDVHVILPAQVATQPGAYAIASLTRDGVTMQNDASWRDDELGERTTFEVTLAASSAPAGEVTLVDRFDDYTTLWAPREPAVASVSLVDGLLNVEVSPAEGGEQGVVYDVVRNGERMARGVSAGVWRDAQSMDHGTRTYCYSAEARFTESGHSSHPSRPICFWGEGDQSRITTIGVENMASGGGGAWSMMHGRAHYENWGDEGHELVVSAWRPDRSGAHLFQFVYGNGSGGFETGITAAAKQLVFEDAWTGEELGRHMVVMPQLSEWSRWGESSFVSMDVDAGRVYRLRLVDGINMSYFEHFSPYTGGTGGGEGTFNRANITQLKILAQEGEVVSKARSVQFDGVEDLGKLAESQRIEPGAKLESWSRWGLEWDDEWVHVTMVSPAFQSEFKAAMMYIEPVSSNDPEGAMPGQGVLYSGQTAQIPFRADFMISWRRQSSGSLMEVPWNGVYVREGTSWRRIWGMTGGEHIWVSGDQHTISMTIPRALFGPESAWRVVGHMAYEQVGEEWKEVLPEGHTPWMMGGTYMEVDLNAPHGKDNWAIKP